NGIMGIYDSEGTVELFGKELDLTKLGEALRNGIAFVSEDRRGVGLLLDESIEFNVVFSAMQIKGDFLIRLGPITIYDQRKAREHTLEMIKTLDIRCTGPKQLVGSLSGGNQQKVCLARALTLNPALLIVSEPTRGIDIGAKRLVLEHLIKLNREEGLTIVVVSSELVELRSMCDRIAIISGGNVAAILEPDAPDAEFGLAMAGLRKEGASIA
ncbi:MAG: ATP-binding cassette domain-containing protein, partial [Bacillota bacterium]